MIKNDTQQTQYDVAIVGLGPTGLILANVLGQAGHRVVVLEREPKFYGNARAVYTDDECMRVYQSIGLADELQKDMLVDVPFQMVMGDGSAMVSARDLSQPYGWPLYNLFYQPYMESALTDALVRFSNVSVMRGRELVDFKQDVECVEVSHQATQSFRYSDESDDSRTDIKGEPDLQTLTARFLVGADGGRSVVRTALKIEMTGRNFPEPWLVVDLKLKDGEDALRHIPYFNFYCDPDCPAVSCPQPDGYHRFEFMLQAGQTKEYMERPSTVREMISKYVDPNKFEVKRKLVYTFNALMAQKWRDGRVFLAGDAAHMTPQFMGQGMSSGVRDAHNLGWKLSMVLNGLADDGLLDTYESERRDHAQAMIDISVLMKDMVSMSNPAATTLRNTLVKTTLVTPGAGEWLKRGGFKPKPTFKKGRYFGETRRRFNGPEGKLSPQPQVRLITGKRVKLDEVTGNKFALIGLGVDPRDTLHAELHGWLEQLDASFTTVFPYCGRPQGNTGVCRETNPGLVEVEDLNGEWIQWMQKAGYSTGSVVILRPDKYCYAIASPSELNVVLKRLRKKLNAQDQSQRTAA
ncbi:bifunctional 3-(3-hydroxy-phenyl)propionate/3-hydroxycinnamic acid hydroxylase [Limnobacter sp.]|uniref:bifunctional 3-(3-hydroxy-phenyl)propionate/3-hydroxycinnamic acid hydroxylase MhpA n=1 Tax=Limnobacter sp. TaxID=2003368 RepID=UPI0025BB77E2|nr:bifunctional 3-(3-hydroxy-phenyl)propionate/3-hydroxycinnamic acid hydroxylase [Limnobacter sp.]